ncbi:50S ribosomal protein L5 [Candidatus Saccharibacteria bacterium RIFCSPLOWO2_01_FULL_48_13]|nr:MAG: 50S ribosomal protein L5 [Candidatus Saccharibacteria bacterium RIFCSPHIGHO2_01_FULL_48_12]OGL35353.1 MAG: 50S ribosomal protein L5 [Candidatus Saccharibacteria bacterium RIFCSPHIGHO2_12_FULL_48_21]OGL37584.1 MAG: 50S ribosomal protein L5 [Candidatus Saccharibacteria bacterium RIFCSPLOWO2_01_FULL_48_13]
MVYQARLKRLYQDEIALQLKDELNLSNIHQVPRLRKIVVNIGLGKAADDKKILEVATNTLRKITGQQPVRTKAKKSIASFKLRAGSTIGLSVTLRDQRMYEFADRLINVVLPRLRDFRGVKSSSFDQNGNYSLGFSDQSVFPELSYEETSTPHGLQITFTIAPSSKEQSKLLLEKLGMPFDDKKGGNDG